MSEDIKNENVRNEAPRNETAGSLSEKAKKTIEAQVNKVLRELNVLGDVGVKHRDEVPDEVVEKIFEHIKKKTAAAKKQFKVNDSQDEFKL